MSSRLIARLDAAIAQAMDPLKREFLKAERAGALARHGQLADARFALSGLRTQNQRHRSPLLAAWIHLVDGLIDHFESMAPRALEKFQRAHEQAVLAEDLPMRALAASWMAAVTFNQTDLPALQWQIREVLTCAPADHHASRTRIGLVLADSLRYAGDDARSQQWYLKARAHASAEGDTSMVSALLHNISTMRCGRISLDDAFGRADADEAAKALLEAESTANYDWGARAAALVAMVPVIRAQLLVVLGRYGEALSLFDAHLARARVEGMGHREARFLADRAWCLAKERRTMEAQRDARAAEQLISQVIDADDRAGTHGRLARVYAELGREAEAAAHQRQADEALLAHQASQRDMLAALDAALA